MGENITGKAYAYTPAYFWYLAISLVITIALVALLKNVKEEKKRAILKWSAIITMVIHLSIVWQHSLFNNLIPDSLINGTIDDPDPAYFIRNALFPFLMCNQMFLIGLFVFKKDKIHNLAHYFIYGALVGAIVTFSFPGAGVDVFWTWLTFKSFLTHSMLLFMGIYAIASKLVVPSMKKFWIFVVGIFTSALIGTIGDWIFVAVGYDNPNFMFTHGGINQSLSWVNAAVIGPVIIFAVFAFINIYEAFTLPKEERWLHKTIKKIFKKKEA